MKKVIGFMFVLVMLIGIAAMGIKLIETMGETAELAEEVHNTIVEATEAKKEYDNLVDDFREDEKYILENYGPNLAGYVYGYRLGWEETTNDVIIHERISTVTNGIYNVRFDTLLGETWTITLEKESV